jgi:molecular chaperone GrpE
VTDPSAHDPASEPPAEAGGSDADAAAEVPVDDDFEAEIAALIGEDLPAGADRADSASPDPAGASKATAADDTAGYGSCEEALEDAVTSLERVTAERDEYLELARRVQAEFENYRKRVEAQRSEQIARAAESLVTELLPVLDACEAAVAHGSTDVEPILASLSATLGKQGLTKVDLADVPFDPNHHEAVLSEPGDGEEEPVVAEVLRAGYHWNGRVLRPAMVKVRG